MLGEAGVEMIDGRDVEAVHPHDGRIARIAVIVVHPRWRQNEITGLHRRPLTVNRGVGALPFDDQPQR